MVQILLFNLHSLRMEVDMIIQGTSNAFAAYSAMKASSVQRQIFPPSSANYAEKVSVSDAARAMLAASQASTQDREIQIRLDAIKAKPAVERTPQDTDYLSENDKRFAEIRDKTTTNGFESLTSDEVDYMQKATGFVNTMASLSPNEKALYDELVAKGKGELAQGLLLVGMSRMGMEGQQVTLPNGRTLDPTNTEVTADNIRNLFKHLFAGDTSATDRTFEALASYLDQRQASDKAINKAGFAPLLNTQTGGSLKAIILFWSIVRPSTMKLPSPTAPCAFPCVPYR
jgi:hypothetical protein